MEKRESAADADSAAAAAAAAEALAELAQNQIVTGRPPSKKKGGLNASYWMIIPITLFIDKELQIGAPYRIRLIRHKFMI